MMRNFSTFIAGRPGTALGLSSGGSLSTTAAKDFQEAGLESEGLNVSNALQKRETFSNSIFSCFLFNDKIALILASKMRIHFENVIRASRSTNE